MPEVFRLDSARLPPQEARKRLEAGQRGQQQRHARAAAEERADQAKPIQQMLSLVYALHAIVTE